MAVSTSFAGAKLEALLLKSSTAVASTSSSSASLSRVSSSSQLSSFYKPIGSRRAGIRKGVRCEATSASSEVSGQNAISNVSALEQLKTSSADSMSESPFRIFFLCFCVYF